MANEIKVIVIDPNEIDRYARAIARIADKGHPAGSVGLVRAVNTYGTAFQFLVMRRGPEYGRALGMAAGNRALRWWSGKMTWRHSSPGTSARSTSGCASPRKKRRRVNRIRTRPRRLNRRSLRAG